MEEAAKGADVINEKHKQEDELVRVEGGTGNSAIITNDSTDAGATVTDCKSTQDLKEDKAETVINKMTNGGLSHNGVGAMKDELRSNLNEVVITLEYKSMGHMKTHII